MKKNIVIIITGGIAAIKSFDVIRRLRDDGWSMRVVMTPAAHHFVTPTSIAALTGRRPLEKLFDDTDNDGFDHIRLSRWADGILVIPASADFLAKMACGMAHDLASALVLARDKPILVAPAMNVRMWTNPATKRNLKTLHHDGVIIIHPEQGNLACGEVGHGRMAEPEAIVRALQSFTPPLPTPPLTTAQPDLKGMSALVTSGATLESIDPVRYISNRSSGRQGHAIAAALHHLGADTLLISGRSHIEPPAGVTTMPVESARDMHRACMDTLPRDIAICAAAVADWRVSTPARDKIITDKHAPPTLSLTANPDVLASICAAGNRRPRLVIGFAAETSTDTARAKEKMAKKNCDWMIHNDVSDGKVMERDDNEITLMTGTQDEVWPRMSKGDVAVKLARRIAVHMHAHRS